MFDKLLELHIFYIHIPIRSFRVKGLRFMGVYMEEKKKCTDKGVRRIRTLRQEGIRRFNMAEN